MLDNDIEIVGGEDMVLDMDTFDFGMIDQEVEEVEEVATEEVEVEEEAEEEAEAEVEEEVEEVEEVEEESEEDVDYESYEITLPSGENVVLSELVNGYKTVKEIEEVRAEVERIKTEFEEKSGGLTRHLELARLEADRVIEDYKDFDWAALSKEDPASYVENREFLDKYKERRREIIASLEDLSSKEEAEKTRVSQEKARSANAALARDLSGWGPDMYRSLCEYAVEVGYDKDTILNCTDAATFKLLHKAMSHDKGVQAVKAKVKRSGGTPKKVVKAAPAKPAVSEAAKKATLLKKAQASGDMTAMFHLLED